MSQPRDEVLYYNFDQVPQRNDSIFQLQVQTHIKQMFQYSALTKRQCQFVLRWVVFDLDAFFFDHVEIKKFHRQAVDIGARWYATMVKAKQGKMGKLTQALKDQLIEDGRAAAMSLSSQKAFEEHIAGIYGLTAEQRFSIRLPKGAAKFIDLFDFRNRVVRRAYLQHWLLGEFIYQWVNVFTNLPLGEFPLVSLAFRRINEEPADLHGALFDGRTWDAMMKDLQFFDQAVNYFRSRNAQLEGKLPPNLKFQDIQVLDPATTVIEHELKGNLWDVYPRTLLFAFLALFMRLHVYNPRRDINRSVESPGVYRAFLQSLGLVPINRDSNNLERLSEIENATQQAIFQFYRNFKIAERMQAFRDRMRKELLDVVKDRSNQKLPIKYVFVVPSYYDVGTINFESVVPKAKEIAVIKLETEMEV